MLMSSKYAKKYKCIKCQAWRKRRHNAGAVVCTERCNHEEVGVCFSDMYTKTKLMRVLEVDGEAE